MQPTSNPLPVATGGSLLKARTFECMGQLSD
jgi:hypothetical protein